MIPGPVLGTIVANRVSLIPRPPGSASVILLPAQYAIRARKTQMVDGNGRWRDIGHPSAWITFATQKALGPISANLGPRLTQPCYLPMQCWGNLGRNWWTGRLGKLCCKSAANGSFVRSELKSETRLHILYSYIPSRLLGSNAYAESSYLRVWDTRWTTLPVTLSTRI